MRICVSFSKLLPSNNAGLLQDIDHPEKYLEDINTKYYALILISN